MCTICAEFRPWTDDCIYDGLGDPPASSSESNSVPVFSMDQIANQLTHGYWGGVSYAWDISGDNTITVGLTGLTSVGQDMARQALQAWSDVTGINFSEVSSSANITFDDNSSGAYAQFSTSGNRITQATINIDPNWAGGQNRTDGYYFQTYLHEIGHALGLGHAGNYNGGATYGVDNHYENDSWQASIMSYFHQTENPNVDASFAYVITPQVADIVAVQSLYGSATVRLGDDTYGNNGSTGTYLDDALALSNPVSFTVFDSGGIDTFDFSEYSADQNVDLREEAYSDVAGLVGNIGISRNTIIEKAISGSGDDSLTGNSSDNELRAGQGNDTAAGAMGHDALGGGGGNDSLAGDQGWDFIEGGSGNDTVTGGDDADLLFGDGVLLADLTATFPTWTPPANAQALLDNGDLLEIWDDILIDVFAIA